MSNTVLDELELELEDGHLRAAAKLAYIKKIGGEDARAQGFIPSDVKIPKGITLYAIHAADGTPIAIMDNRDAAFGAALQNDLIPLSVH